MIGVALAVGLATLAVGVAASLLLRMLPSVRLQLSGLVLIAVALPLSAVMFSGLVMFHMGAAGEVLAVSLAAALAGVVGALLVGQSIAARLERVRRASVELAAGDLSARAPEGGPTELAELADSFNAMARHLEEVFDARRQLVAWASHDLRAPITSLQAMLEAMEDGVVGPEHYLETLHGQVRLLASLVDDLFELACIDAGATTVNLVPVDLGALASACVARHQVEAEARRVRLHSVRRGPGTWALAAPEKVDRVLTNLVTNALHYTPPGGVITASVTGGAGAVFVSVEDTGPGIPDADLQRVFEPFWRADVARTPGGSGAGLGLAIARGLIEAQGGTIWAEPPGRGGTRICFVLPAADVAGDEAPLAYPDARTPGTQRPGPVPGSVPR